MSEVIGYQLSKSIRATANFAGGLAYQLLAQKQQLIAINGYENIQVLDTDPVESPAGLGIPVWMSLSMQTPSYTYANKSYPAASISIPCTIVAAYRVKNIVETVIYGRDGTVKELTSRGDWKITVDGILCNDDNKYPYDLVNNLKSVDDYPLAFKITHRILNKIGVTHIVTNRLEWIVTPGEINSQAFRWELTSDEAYQLQLTNDQAILKTT
jgi:hypothetical protein